MHRPGLILSVLLALSALACSAPDATLPAAPGESASLSPSPARHDPAPRLVVLGTAQDGGLPHAGCSGERCERARRDPRFARSVSSVGLVLPTGESYLFDATPDVAEQVFRLSRHRPRRDPDRPVDRNPVEGVFLTHAHIGHYLGLAQFGFEVLHSQALPVYATPRMSGFLRDNGPWEQLVRLGNIQLVESPPGEEIRLGDGVRVVPFAVPHRDEYSDTVGFRIEGPRRTAVYLPDTEPWDRWETPVETLLEGVDVAFLDGTFYSSDELPGREVSSIGHPLMVDTVERLGALEGLGVVFIHLNHSNPALTAESSERARLEAAGFRVAEEGMELPL